MIWWYWLMLGLGLLALGAAMPRAFVPFRAGLAAIAVALLLALGLEPPGPGQWGVFGVLSLASLFLPRRRARAAPDGPPRV